MECLQGPLQGALHLVTISNLALGQKVGTYVYILNDKTKWHSHKGVRSQANYTRKMFCVAGVLDRTNEKGLVARIQHLARAGFAPGHQRVRCLVYQFAENLGLKYKFSQITKMAGYAWLLYFHSWSGIPR
ncbi:hypothetical protein PR048_023293 [Dryococelus australis]|uniref:Uncharacterized protein n=1 Tax=Dryococelus australis TaxID=614101 RepID=A0ABQ9GTP5_9NEOP|nr:hypothetical protein PR048_023293 [Dryococelus australis]